MSGSIFRKIDELPVGKFLVLCLFLVVLAFQAFLVTRWTPLYALLRILFFGLLALVLLGVLRLARRDRGLLLCLVFIAVVRVPFYLQPDGLLFNSDGALEALQPLEIRDDKAAPFFLLDSSSHNGTLKYTCLAFLYECFGSNYLVFLLFQLLVYLGFIVLLCEWLRPVFGGKAVLPLIFAHFAFIEVLFDYSLLLRGGPYLEMLFFFVLGVRLMDFTFRDMRRVFLAVYFLMTAVYLHSLAVFPTAALLLAAALYSLRARVLLRFAAVLAAGAAAGQYHFIYYKFFYPPPPPAALYQIHFFNFGDFSLSRIPVYLAQVGRDFLTCFNNILSFEFTYQRRYWSSFEYYFRSETTATALHALNRFLVVLSFLVFLAALGLVLSGLVRRRFFGAAERDWVHPFFLLLLLIILGKLFLLSPAPHIEPRHNVDLALLLVLSYVIVFAEILRRTGKAAWKQALAAVLLTVLAAPHYFTFLRVAAFKHDSYGQIMPILKENGIKYLSADFGIAYIVHLLSDRRIYVSDTIGPTTFEFFYPRMREKVDRVPLDRKAYLFYAREYPGDKSIHWICHELFEEVREKLIRGGHRFKLFRPKYYLLIIPEESKVYHREANLSGLSPP